MCFPHGFPQKSVDVAGTPPSELAHGVEPTAAPADPTRCVSCGGEDSSELRGRSGNSSGHYLPTQTMHCYQGKSLKMTLDLYRFVLFDSTIMGNLMNPRGKGKDF